MLKPILVIRIKATVAFLGVLYGTAQAQSLVEPSRVGVLEPKPDQFAEVSDELEVLEAEDFDDFVLLTFDEPAPRADGFTVHLASYYSRADAERGWSVLTDTFPGLLSGYAASFSRVDLGYRGDFVRLLAGPLPDRAEAHQLCEAIRDAGAYCLPADQEGALLNLEDHGR